MPTKFPQSEKVSATLGREVAAFIMSASRKQVRQVKTTKLQRFSGESQKKSKSSKQKQGRQVKTRQLQAFSHESPKFQNQVSK